jgi:hypothetical protein
MSFLKDFPNKEFDESSICDFIAEQRYFDVYYNLPVKIRKKIDVEAKQIKQKWEKERVKDENLENLYKEDNQIYGHNAQD